LELVELLLKAGAKVNDAATHDLYACRPFDNGMTPLLGAIKRSDDKLVKRLLEAGAKVNAIVCGTQTALEYTRDCINSPTIEEILIDAGADVTRLDRTPAITLAGAPPPPPPPAMAHLNPPNPAFAGGKRPKDSAYYSGRPGEASGSGAGLGGGGSIGTPESHATWSAPSPSVSNNKIDRKEPQRMRQLERSWRPPAQTVDYS
jgi:ankyrin repeat protein